MTNIKEKSPKKIMLALSAYYFIYAAGTAAHQSLIPLLLEDAHLTDFQTGIAMSMLPIFTIIALLFWGNVSDKAKYKNNILIFLTAVSGILGFMFLFKLNFIGYVIVISIFVFFYASVFPLIDAFILESGNKFGFKFNPVRMCATIGYAIMVLLNGLLGLKTIFLVACFIYFISLIPFLYVPKIEGHRKAGQKFDILSVILKKPVIMLYLTIFTVNITYGFHSSFFPKYFINEIGDNFQLSLVIFMTPILEIVFFAFADKIAKVVDIRVAVFVSSLIMALRWLFYSVSQNFYVLFFFALTQGIAMLTPYYYTMRYTSQITPPQGNATIQTVNFIIFAGISRALGSVGGGFIVNFMSVREVYMLCGVMCLTIGLVFICSRTKFDKLI